MIEILNVNKEIIPAQDSILGTITIKTILYKKDDKYSCAQGIGDDDWICSNGHCLTYYAASVYFENIHNLKNNWA